MNNGFSFKQYLIISIFCIVIVVMLFLSSTAYSIKNPLDVGVLLFPIVSIGIGLYFKKRGSSPANEISEINEVSNPFIRLASFSGFVFGIVLLFHLKDIFELLRGTKSEIPFFGFGFGSHEMIYLIIIYVTAVVGLVAGTVYKKF